MLKCSSTDRIQKNQVLLLTTCIVMVLDVWHSFCYIWGFNVHFQYFISLYVDAKINIIIIIALATCTLLLYGCLLKIPRNIVRGENTKLELYV